MAVPNSKTSPMAMLPQAVPRTVSPQTPLSPPNTTRVRSSSFSAPTPSPAHSTTRKRTSSGVFHVDDAEPPPKKTELELKSEGNRKKADITNGRRKSDKEQASADKVRHSDSTKKKDISIVESFDSESKGKTVSAFKESDSWD